MASSAGRLTAPNGMTQNSLSSNALFQNALFQNSLMQNSLMQNSLMQNSLMQNGLLSGVLWQDALWQQNPAALEALRANQSTRDLLKYVYECAMGPTQSTVLDPSPGGANLELHGLVGLAPGWGQPGGACDESCQRWVTACVLARTNAYGVKVDLSMRAPDDAPAHVKAALAVTDEERAAYPLREGAFYGNLFRQEGPPNGTAVMAPRFYACAGPGSNVPEVTKRFCSSQGAGGPIGVPGTCEPRPEFPRAACLGVSGDAATGAMRDCYERTDPANRGEHYREVITVYLKRPIEVCGNSVCEEDEEDATNAGAEGACPSDCHPGGWTRSFAVPLGGSVGATGDQADTDSPDSWVRISAHGPGDTLVLAGVAPSTIDLGGGPLEMGPDGKLYGALAKYSPKGDHLWSKRFGFGFSGQVVPTSVAVAPDGSIGVAMTENDAGGSRIWLGKFKPNGDLEWSRSLAETAHDNFNFGAADTLAIDQSGNLFLSGVYSGRVTFGTIVLGHPSQPERQFVLKVSPDGVPQWAVNFTYGTSWGAKTLTVDQEGNALLSLDYNAKGVLWKLDATTGDTMWQRSGFYGGVAVGPNNHVYATGALDKVDTFDNAYSFDVPPTASRGDFFVVEYAADGTPLNAHVLIPECGDSAPPCGTSGWVEGRHIAFDAAGNVVIGVLGGGSAPIDFGAGAFPTYATEDVFVAAFSPELVPLWAKHIPMVLSGTVRGLHLDSLERVVLSGTFAGSMLVDDRMLVSTIPEQAGVSNTFLAKFGVPKTSDVTPPVVTEAHVPKPMTLEATGTAGTEVFFLPPTSLDGGNAGVSVQCTPPPNSVFPIGTTVVTCTATDPLGHQASESFVVTVVDHLGPAFGNVPAAVTAGATSPAGAVVTYDPPLAVDLVDGERTVACSPASGSAFALGTTTVTCEAEDTKGVLTMVSFPVHVRYGGESCGNGTLDEGEECDDGNTADGDGCASSCALENEAPDCSGASASPAFLLASSGQMWAPVAIDGVTDPDGDPVTVVATGVWQDEPVSTSWCPGGTCADATLEPLAVRAERDTWSPTNPQPDGRVYHIEFTAKDPQGAHCTGVATVCVLRHYDLASCGDGGPLYSSLGL
ncbi:MAG TPA: HYR domain-containing protein [Polyangiaceae bacterium]|nr:HYR domain-containing protein [Polyangiaceae bacterium]